MRKLRQGRKKTSSISANFEDSDSDEPVYNAPGPGSYYNYPTETTFKANNSANYPFQYFGTTSPRFSNADKDKVPGPGTYKETVVIPKNSPKPTSLIKSEKTNETVFEKYISPGPGPGNYNNQSSDFRPKKYYKNKKGGSTFISAERRFLDRPEYIKNPGPGKYFDKKDPLAIRGPLPKFDSNFGFKSDRNPEDYLLMNEKTPMYNLQDHNSIGQKKVITIRLYFLLFYSHQQELLIILQLCIKRKLHL